MALALTACPSKKPDSPATKPTETPAAEVKTPLDASFVDSRKSFFVTPDGKAENDGSSWAKAKDLKSAIDAAHADATKKTLLVAEGTYYADSLKSNPNVSFEIKPGLKIYGGFVATVPLKRNTNTSILDGLLQKAEGTKEAVHTNTIVNGKNLTAGTILDGFLIQNAKGNEGWTGPLTLDNSTLELNNLTFSHNHGAYAGAIYFQNNSDLSISNSSFSNNSARGYGGAITGMGSKLKIMNSNFSNNKNANKPNEFDSGGAIYALAIKPLIIGNSNFSKNKASVFGGAIYNKSSNLKIANSSFSNNSAGEYTSENIGGIKNGSGGAIFNDGTSTLEIYNSILWNNEGKHTGSKALNNIYNGKANIAPKIKHSILNADSAVTKQGDDNQKDYSKTDPYDFMASDAKFKKNQTPAAFSIDAKGKVASANQDLIKAKGDMSLYEDVTKEDVYSYHYDGKDLAGNLRAKNSIDIGAYQIQR